MSVKNHNDSPDQSSEKPSSQDVLTEVGQLKDEIAQLKELVSTNSMLIAKLVGDISSAANRALTSSYQQLVIDSCEYALVGVLSQSGATGVIEVESNSGSRLALKVFPLEAEEKVRRGVEVGNLARKHGVPVPGGMSVGKVGPVVYSLQDIVLGTTSSCVSLEEMKQLLGTIERSRDIYLGPANFTESLIEALSEGNSDIWCDHRDIVLFGGRPKKLLDRLSGVANLLGGVSFRETDGVHWDASHRNALFENGKLSAVVDWEAAIWGDNRYDLVNLEFWSHVHRGNEVSTEACEYVSSVLSQVVSTDELAGLSALVGLHHLNFTVRNRPDLIETYISNAERYLLSRLA